MPSEYKLTSGQKDIIEMDTAKIKAIAQHIHEKFALQNHLVYGIATAIYLRNPNL